MIERQRGDDRHPVNVRRLIEQRLLPGFDLQHIGDEVAVKQRRALRNAGGAAGILQEGDVVGTELGVGQRAPLAGRERVIEAHCAGQRIGRHHLLDLAHHEVGDRAFQSAEHVADRGDDDVLDLGLRQRLLQHAGEILQHDDGLGAGIGELEFEFARLVERIDVDDREAGAQHRGDRDHVLQHVRHHEGDACAALEPKRLQVSAERARGGIDFAERQRLAHEKAGSVIAKALAAVLDQMRKRRDCRHIDVGRHALRIMR